MAYKHKTLNVKRMLDAMPVSKQYLMQF